MYTYLENIDQVKTRHNFPCNLIGKIKDIQLYDTAIPFYKFILYNDNHDQEYPCVVKENEFERLQLKESDSIVIEYAPIQNFMDIGDCFLIRRIHKPILNLTGNKNEDIITLMELTRKLIESEFQDGKNLIWSRHSQVNIAYLKYRKIYLESRKRR